MMSKERELLIEAVEWMHELKYVWANVRDSGDYDLLELIAGINKIEKLLAQPEQVQEPVAWQYRTKPNWQENWSKWEDCRKESYEDYIRVPLLHNWLYETRRLYTSPPTREPLSTKQAEDLWETTFKNAVPYYIFDEICVAVEEYHGIGVDDE